MAQRRNRVFARRELALMAHDWVHFFAHDWVGYGRWRVRFHPHGSEDAARRTWERFKQRWVRSHVPHARRFVHAATAADSARAGLKRIVEIRLTPPVRQWICRTLDTRGRTRRVDASTC